MAEVVLKNRKVNINKLLSYGFEKVDSVYVYQTDLVDRQMSLTVRVKADGILDTVVFDRHSGDQYVLHQVAGATGAFVGRVKAEYEAVLAEIAAKCYERDVFKSQQAKAVIAYAKTTYGDEPEYLWEKFPDNAVLRRKDNRKWYAALLTVSRSKLGVTSDQRVEILDLRLPPDEMEQTVDRIRYFPGYHMNKKHWITICLDGSVSLQEICRRIDDSYQRAR